MPFFGFIEESINLSRIRLSSCNKIRYVPDNAGHIMDSWAHEGQIKRLMFSMKPRMGRFTFRQKSTCLRTSSNATS